MCMCVYVIFICVCDQVRFSLVREIDRELIVSFIQVGTKIYLEKSQRIIILIFFGQVV